MGHNMQVFLNRRRQLTFHEFVRDCLFIVSLGDKRIKVIILDEFFENVAANDKRPGHFHFNIFIFIRKKGRRGRIARRGLWQQL